MDCIVNSLKKTDGAQELLRAVVDGKLPCFVSRLARGAQPHLLYFLSRQSKKNIYFVCATDYEARTRFEEYLYGNRVFLPAPGLELRAVEAKGNETATQRVAALTKLAQKGGVCFLSIDSLLYKMRPRERFYDRFLNVKKGQIIQPLALIREFVARGYERSELIEASGLVSGRGEIVEVYPPGAPNPYRITFFDDEIESIRYFDTDTQRSFGQEIDQVAVPPASEMCLQEEEQKALGTYLREAAVTAELESAAQRYLYELERSGSFANIEAYAGVLPGARSVADERDAVIILDGSVRILADYEARERQRQAMFAEVLSQHAAFGCEDDCRFEGEAFFEEHAGQIVDLADVRINQAFRAVEIGFEMREAAGYLGKIDMLAEAVGARLAEGWKVYLFAGPGARRLSEALKEIGLLAPVTGGKPLEGPGAACVAARLTQGFELPGERELFLSEKEIFGVRAKARARRTKPKAQKNELLADLRPGDIIVHELHGKGRFVGLRNMEVAGVRGDYMELEYRDGDRLYIQTSQIDRVQKYVGPGDEAVRLSKLGGKEWENTKSKARSSIKKLAEDLADIYRERASQKGYAYSEDTVWQRQFEDNFEYEETPGQEESIREIKRDMESGKIMDRLLLGDVGYGKTEVAMRACFKAVMDSKQTAVLVPTTLLARQHYETFKERFSGFPVRIAMLSRFTKKPAEVLEQLASGKVDIVIGTHKLLGKAVKFHDLGLLVIDEEQRFGVSHKERIKDLKRSVDVLTLTATPIPRTLEMAMTGIRDMSTIDTPPSQRKEVQAYVAAFDWGLVRSAVLKELARGGQVYFVCRKIGEMEYLERMLRQTVPEARICTAHGQMGEVDFDRVVTAFLEREYDVLLCTTIIESGIDIPSVNTLIVYEADKFGLAQLYQLKGRVGRSKVRAYAYFTHLGGEAMSETAAKRLNAIREFTQFGSGMKIAMRDLEIRGAGNILGAEQSGHMAQIGYSLYCKLVREQVLESMGKSPVKAGETAVELGVDAFIPPSYIGNEAQKMDMYRRVAEADTREKGRDIRQEFFERFGPLPKEVENLISASVVRGYAARAHVASAIRKGRTVELKFMEQVQMDVSALLSLLKGYESCAALRRSNPPVIVFSLENGHKYSEMLQLLEQIKHCIS